MTCYDMIIKIQNNYCIPIENFLSKCYNIIYDKFQGEWVLLKNTSKVDSITKAASIIIALGADVSSEIFKYLRDDEIEELSLQITKMDSLTPQQSQEIMNEFYEQCITQKVISEGGETYAKDVLLKAFGKERAGEVMERIQKNGRQVAFEFLKKVDYKTILMMIQNEHPQTIALVLSYTSPEVASKILAELPPNLQVSVFQRIANLDRTSPEVIKVVENIMLKKLGSMASVDMVEVGGINYLAEVMNNVDMKTEKYIFEEISGTTPELVEEIRKRMFVFEDITRLDNMEIQAFIRECDTKDLTIALKTASQEISDAIFGNMSQRQQETIKTDMQYLHNIRMSDVEEAQQRIIAVIRKLEEQGTIVISKGEKDAIIQ